MQVKGYTFSKIINHSSLLTEIQSYTLGSSNSAKDMLYDYYSGEVLLSSLKDEFNDPLYHFSYPTHWKHRSFLNMNQMDSYEFSPIVGTNFISQPLNVNFEFVEGDMLKITQANSQVINAWVLDIKYSLFIQQAHLIDINGNEVNYANLVNSKVKVIRTGRKNRVSEEMMTVTTKRNPINLAGTKCLLAVSEDELKDALPIIDVSAVIYGEKSNVPCPAKNQVNSMSYLLNSSTSNQFAVDQKVNPFLIGAKGNLQVINTLSYQEQRKSNDVNGIRQDGEIFPYKPFYRFKNSGQPSNKFKQWYAINETLHPNYESQNLLQKWRILGTIDSYDEQHTPIQVSDQIKVKSSHLKIFDKNQNVIQEASASNAKYSEIGFDGFEFSQNVAANMDNGFNLNQMSSGGQIVSSTRHSGSYSLSVNQNASAQFPVITGSTTCSDNPNIVNYEYFIRDCNCIPNFQQEANKKYFFSLWVKEDAQVATYINTSVVLSFYAGNNLLSSITFLPSGNIIDGWQKIEGSYSIPIGTTSIKYDFVNSSNDVSYFDDFRTHPFLAAMQTIIYDEKTLLPMASHDAYNFTTFYNYDNNHSLIRINMETLDGIKTISEEETGSFRVGQ